jgi:DNA-directed RNA polymerase subunit RPC12/RpoP
MLEPEYQDITCPECRQREVYFDQEIGYYCMFCGRQFSTEEMQALVERELSATTDKHT